MKLYLMSIWKRLLTMAGNEKSIAVSGELKEQKMNIARKIIEAQMFNLLLHRHWRKTRVTGWCGLLAQNLNWNTNAFSFLFCAMANINLKN